MTSEQSVSDLQQEWQTSPRWQGIERGYNAVVNLRLETTRMANARRGGGGIAGLEVLAYGTGLRLHRDPS